MKPDIVYSVSLLQAYQTGCSWVVICCSSSEILTGISSDRFRKSRLIECKLVTLTMPFCVWERPWVNVHNRQLSHPDSYYIRLTLVERRLCPKLSTAMLVCDCGLYFTHS
jgi:hypothetical protein